MKHDYADQSWIHQDVSLIERVALWMQRHPLIATSLLVVLFLLAGASDFNDGIR